MLETKMEKTAVPQIQDLFILKLRSTGKNAFFVVGSIEDPIVNSHISNKIREYEQIARGAYPKWVDKAIILSLIITFIWTFFIWARILYIYLKIKNLAG